MSPLSFEKWRQRYGDTRADRADKIHRTLPPNAVNGIPPPRPLWAWSSALRQDGTQDTVASINMFGVGSVDFYGHVEVRSDDSVRLRRRFVRSQRCTEPQQSLFSQSIYKVRIRAAGGREDAVSCTCPDWSNQGPCKHMLAVNERLSEEQDEAVQAALGYDPDEEGLVEYLQSLEVAAQEVPEADDGPDVYVTRSGRPVRRPKKYGRDEYVSAAVGWVFT